MPFELTWNGPELIRRVSGRVSASDFIESSLIVQGDPRFDNLRSIINDLRDCTEVAPLDTERIREIAARDYAANLSNPRVRAAMVATHPMVVEATRQYMASGLSPFTIEIFDTMEKARAWLARAR